MEQQAAALTNESHSTMRTLIVALALMATSCTDAAGARKALQQAGYSEIEIGGYSWFACGKGDDWATKFKAKGPTGVPVTGAVCSGILKGKTIRLD